MNQTLFEGIKRSVEKGESLQQAMMSFYNAGYPKSEIEEAAREVQKIQLGMQPQQQIIAKPLAQGQQPIQKVSSYTPTTNTQMQRQQTQQKPTQQISNYSQPQKQAGGKGLIVFLIILLAVLVGGLITVILLKDKLAGLI